MQQYQWRNEERTGEGRARGGGRGPGRWQGRGGSAWPRGGNIVRRQRVGGAAAVVVAAWVVAGCVAATEFTPTAPTVPSPRLPMNDTYVGSVHTGAGLAPRLVWEASTASTSQALRYELQYGTDREFGGDTVTVETSELSYQVPGELAVATTPPVGARYYWRVRACVRDTCSEYSRAWWINLGRVIRDYNGDGYSDVAVGAPGNDGVIMDGGRVLVYFGGPGRTLDGTPDVYLGTFYTTDPLNQLGGAVTYAGDVNGDGFGDLLLGRAGNPDGNVPGAGYIFVGGVPMRNEVALTVSTGIVGDGFGYRVRGLGDINGDGFSDFAVVGPPSGTWGTHIYLGNGGPRLSRTLAGRLSSHSSYASEVNGVGDVNGDGFADVVLGDSGSGMAPGTAALYLGGSDVRFDRDPDRIMMGASDGDLFGSSVAGADFSCDGFSDVLVANERSDDVGIRSPGRVDLFLGGAGSSLRLAYSFHGQVESDAFGRSLAPGGDFNGDGCADFAVGAVLTKENGMLRGRGYVYFGGASLDTTPEAVLYAPPTASNAFALVRDQGDVNGDGYSDLGAADHAFGPSGAVDLYLGGAGAGFDATFDSRLVGAAAGDYFGTSF